ncbi:MAG TPA: ABC transporter permease subunit [Candidatus Marinimicrobia bacterium]|jgi:ABC-2 type transport system permease protein|nr:ABC transporter permease subunit [Candidatus Neomarinimicrobiota bacterium]HPA99579.1 ABC transporter permease subunit [Candidatus Neomarinimicrobiota bacterium]HPY00400.1 ABC transporter permease subunit [Candidatus Neomarinimicrobiota bacterium]HQC61597.1 ABC transporter permease subunit [Candidatus Neomarinimicrobiota bacterium]HQO74319.1 ABC transporter permease subunit [Candidatus Neomarinimicrobiota bacterium]
MSNLLAIYKRDLKGYFFSPIAYVVIGLFLLVNGIFFYVLLSSFLEYSYAVMIQRQGYPINVNLLMIRPFFQNMSVIVLFVIPMITMRSFSEEKKSGTMELLLTSPVTNWQLILGKFLASFTLYFVMVMVTFLFMVFLLIWGNPSLVPILISYLGILLMGLVLVALGNFISSLTENQIVAAVGTFGATMFLWVIGFAGDFAGKVFGEIFKYLSIVNHFDDFSKGVFDTNHLVYYLSLTFLMLFFTYQSIESSKWRG